MSELTEAEKRRLLRERRQKKFSNGGASSRLNKITGQAS
nr:Chain C, GOLGI TO ER TRAFFIC PROTEIN 2 [Saccharomyces cerevisiae]3ZS9_D Chain D, GOLGI TO ER TRAFFIC PROTEIN 2 [Saccharomyces cerevisiae]